MRKDKTVCLMVVTRHEGAVAMPNGEESRLHDFLDRVDAATIDGKQNLKTSTPEYRLVNGVPTLRQYYSYLVSGSHDTASGFIYLFLDDHGIISVAGMDAVQHANKILPLIEAAALTVHDQ